VPGRLSGGVRKNGGVKFNKVEFLKLLSHELNADLLISVFKVKRSVISSIAVVKILLP